VQEWCLNTYEQDTSIGTDGKRVVRGGSWNYNQGNQLLSLRYRNFPDDRNYGIGFRLAQDLDP